MKRLSRPQLLVACILTVASAARAEVPRGQEGSAGQRSGAAATRPRAQTPGSAPSAAAAPTPARGAAAAQPAQAGKTRPAPGTRSSLLPVATPSFADPDEPLRHIEDHILVRFAPDVSTASQQRVTRALGGREYFPMAALDFGRVMLHGGEDTRRALARFRDDPRVEHAELDYLYPIAAPQEPFDGFQWTMDRIRVREAEEINSTGGNGVVVAVIDTGIAPPGAYTQCADLAQARVVRGLNLFTGRNDPIADHYHGTFIATQIAAPINGAAGRGIAPRVSIMPIRACRWFCEGNDCGSGPRCPTSAWANGIVWATDHGADAINLSLGGPQESQVGREAVEYAHDRDVVIVAASGNGSQRGRMAPVDFPAAYPEVIAVGATDFDDRRAAYSNGGPNLDLVAPVGNDLNRVVGRHRDQAVRDAAVGGWFQFDPVGEVYGDCGWTWSLGTSFAAPQVAAAAALFKAFGVRDPEDIRVLLRLRARDVGAQAFDNETGFGVLDVRTLHDGFAWTFPPEE